MGGDSVWVLGDQLHRGIASLDGAEPGRTRVLLIECDAKIASKRWHRQRLHLVLSAMRHFAAELRAEGFVVDLRRAPTFDAGLAAHRAEHRPARVRVMEPLSWDLRARLAARRDVTLVRSNQFLCHADEFRAWAGGRPRLRMEEFYRWQRVRLGILMDGERPAGGAWNYDRENRERPPADGNWSAPLRSEPDAIDRAVAAALPANVFGSPPDGTWATSRQGALLRLQHFVDEELPRFGPHQDAMTERSWHLAHALLSPYLNLGMLTPREVCDAAEAAWRRGRVPLPSVEGFVRQIIGWREYVHGVYWLWSPGFRDENRLGADRPLPPAFTDPRRTRMRCLGDVLRGIEARGYAHHIQRLMVLANLALLAGVAPPAMVEWMWASFVDGAEWVMLPNVVGMGLHADGGRMMTKPYAAGGAYIDRMSDHCRGCPYDPRRRTGDDACPFTTLYWDFLARHRERFANNPRLRQPLAGLARLSDLPAVRARAREVLALLDRGAL